MAAALAPFPPACSYSKQEDGAASLGTKQPFPLGRMYNSPVLVGQTGQVIARSEEFQVKPPAAAQTLTPLLLAVALPSMRATLNSTVTKYVV